MIDPVVADEIADSLLRKLEEGEISTIDIGVIDDAIRTRIGGMDSRTLDAYQERVTRRIVSKC